MNRAPVSRVAADGLSRQVWEFRYGEAAYGDGWGIALVAHSIERRAVAKGRFRKAPPADRWLSSDERPYNSGRGRPEYIPADVMGEAIRNAPPVRVYIGWANARSEYCRYER